jgi:hypothetical protein
VAVGLAASEGTPGAHLVNTIPICNHAPPFRIFILLIFKVKYLPEWFPGAGFQKKAKIWKKIVLDMPAAPFQFVKRQFVSDLYWFINDWRFKISAQELGNAKPSLTATLLEEAYAQAEDHKIKADEEELICNLTGVVYGGGADTVSQVFRVSCFSHAHTWSISECIYLGNIHFCNDLLS